MKLHTQIYIVPWAVGWGLFVRCGIEIFSCIAPLSAVADGQAARDALLAKGSGPQPCFLHG